MSGTAQPLDFTIAFPDHRDARVYCSKIPLPRLAADIADILRMEAPAGGIKSPGEAKHTATLMAAFSRHLIEEGIARSAGFADIRPMHVDSFDRARRRRLPDSSSGAYITMEQLHKILILAKKHGHMHPTMLPRLTYVSLKPFGDEKPRDSYSDFVRTQIEDAAGSECEALAERIGPIRPTTRDALPIIIMLSLQDPALPIESVKELEAGCLSADNGRYASLAYIKRRAQEGKQSVRVKSKDPLTPGRLVRTYQAASLALRGMARFPETEFLFLVWSHQNNAATRVTYDLLGTANIAFCARHRIVDEKGSPIEKLQLSRLRKTAKDKRYRDVLGRLKVFANDHSPGVAARHYASIPGLLSLHEATIEAGLKAALATTSRIIVQDPEEDGEDGLQRDDNDVLTASCDDITDSPYGVNAAGRCKAPVWGCLDCRNARIGRSHLPAIVAFQSFLIERREQMNLDDWIRQLGRAHLLITRDILPAFKAPDIAWATGIAEAEQELKWLRNELQTLVS